MSEIMSHTLKKRKIYFVLIELGENKKPIKWSQQTKLYCMILILNKFFRFQPIKRNP